MFTNRKPPLPTSSGISLPFPDRNQPYLVAETPPNKHAQLVPTHLFELLIVCHLHCFQNKGIFWIPWLRHDFLFAEISGANSSSRAWKPWGPICSQINTVTMWYGMLAPFFVFILFWRATFWFCWKLTSYILYHFHRDLLTSQLTEFYWSR